MHPACFHIIKVDEVFELAMIEKDEVWHQSYGHIPMQTVQPCVFVGVGKRVVHGQDHTTMKQIQYEHTITQRPCQLDNIKTMAHKEEQQTDGSPQIA